MTSLDHLGTDGPTPLAELEQAVQARAKDIALDMATPAGPVRSAGPASTTSSTDGTTTSGAVGGTSSSPTRRWSPSGRGGTWPATAPSPSCSTTPTSGRSRSTRPPRSSSSATTGPAGTTTRRSTTTTTSPGILTKLLDDSSTSHRKLDASEGLQDAQLDDGSRLHIVHGDLARGGHLMVNIRRFTGVPFTDLDELVERGTLSRGAARFLTAAVRAGATIVFAGAPGSGKTTLLSCCVGALDPSLRVVIAEEVFEIDAPLPNVASMQTRAASSRPARRRPPPPRRRVPPHGPRRGHRR